MRRLLTLCIAFSAVSVSAGSGRYLISINNPPETARVEMLRDSGERRVHAIRTFSSVHAFAASLSDSEVAALKRSPDVRYISPVVERHAFVDGPLRPATESSPYVASQTTPYGIKMVHAPQLWNLTEGAGPINIAILDSGVDVQHPDLAANIAGGYNTYTGTANATDDFGHGTHVTGTIAARDNGFGVVGVAPQSRIWMVKVLDNHGFGADENVVAGIDWVMQKKQEIGGDWIMSLSLGSPQLSYVERDAFKKAIDAGIVVVAAAGNSASEDVQYPAQYPGVIAVGALDSTSTLARFSDHGPRLDVVAPGVDVLSTAIRGSVPAAAVTIGGTSIAASAIEGSSRGDVIGTTAACGLGRPQDFPPDAQGRIALIQRGEITFNEKVRNAQAAHASAVIIYNKDGSDYHNWTLLRPDCSDIADCDDPVHSWPVVLAVSADDGQRLVNDPQHTVDMGSWLDDYKLLSGTSMATPHVSGVLALIWSLNPGASADQVRDALFSTTHDLGSPGFDPMYGRGLVDAVRAAAKLAPWLFEHEVKVPPDRKVAQP